MFFQSLILFASLSKVEDLKQSFYCFECCCFIILKRNMNSLGCFCNSGVPYMQQYSNNFFTQYSNQYIKSGCDFPHLNNLMQAFFEKINKRIVGKRLAHVYSVDVTSLRKARINSGLLFSCFLCNTIIH